jgi:hypothetical protein
VIHGIFKKKNVTISKNIMPSESLKFLKKKKKNLAPSTYIKKESAQVFPIVTQLQNLLSSIAIEWVARGGVRRPREMDYIRSQLIMVRLTHGWLFNWYILHKNLSFYFSLYFEGSPPAEDP